jgi:hypothetical protein
MGWVTCHKQTTTEKTYPFSAVLSKDDLCFPLFMSSPWKRAASPGARPVAKFIVRYWEIKSTMA